MSYNGEADQLWLSDRHFLTDRYIVQRGMFLKASLRRFKKVVEMFLWHYRMQRRFAENTGSVNAE
jgi:hypothetical protein